MGHKDLYDFPAVTADTIFDVVVRGFVSKSDSGARTMDFNMKSGVTDSAGSHPGQALATSPQWQRSRYATDPATGVAWTVSGLNAAKSGMSVAS